MFEEGRIDGTFPIKFPDGFKKESTYLFAGEF
jgi:hypothetical protein